MVDNLFICVLGELNMSSRMCIYRIKFHGQKLIVDAGTGSFGLHPG